MARMLLILAALFCLSGTLWLARENSSPRSPIALKAEFDPQAKAGIWRNNEVPVPSGYLARLISEDYKDVLGQTAEEKRIEINLSTQTLSAFQGDRVVYAFPISSGLPWTPTVTGDFRLWAKVRSQRMTGGSRENGSFYDLPNVPFVQYFYSDYSLHGAYWHNDFGKPRSHGCVNMRPEDARIMFYWTEPLLPEGQYLTSHFPKDQATRVTVFGQTPTQNIW